MKKYCIFLFIALIWTHCLAQEKDSIADYKIAEVKNPYSPSLPKQHNDKHTDKQQIKEAEYPGGRKAFYTFIANNIIYPQIALDNGTEGWLIIRFVVETDGSISNIEVIKDIGDGCAEAVIKALEKTEKWKSAQLNGEVVRSYYKFPISFTILLEEVKEEVVAK